MWKQWKRKRENITKLNHELNWQQRHELGYKLNTMDSKTELCKRLNTVEEGDKFFLAFLWTLG
jgi:hypothetical protein